MTTRRLRLVWRGGGGRRRARWWRGSRPRLPAGAVRQRRCSAGARTRTGRALLRALAVAGFAAGNVMLISIGIWAGVSGAGRMGPATRSLLHWVSALIALPAIAYAGMPFFASAAAALRHGAHQHGRADQRRRAAGHRHEPGADDRRRRAHLFRFRHHAAVLPADRPRAGPSRARPGARHRGTAADAAHCRRRGAAGADGSTTRRAQESGGAGRPRAGRHGRADRRRRRGGTRHVIARRQPGDRREPAGRGGARHAWCSPAR